MYFYFLGRRVCLFLEFVCFSMLFWSIYQQKNSFYSCILVGAMIVIMCFFDYFVRFENLVVKRTLENMSRIHCGTEEWFYLLFRVFLPVYYLRSHFFVTDVTGDIWLCLTYTSRLPRYYRELFRKANYPNNPLGEGPLLGDPEGLVSFKFGLKVPVKEALLNLLIASLRQDTSM